MRDLRFKVKKEKLVVLIDCFREIKKVKKNHRRKFLFHIHENIMYNSIMRPTSNSIQLLIIFLFRCQIN